MELSAQQQQELSETARLHAAAYVRVKALVILNVARGRRITEVADIFMVSRQSVYSWVERYLARGVEGLAVQAGRGRRESFKCCG